MIMENGLLQAIFFVVALLTQTQCESPSTNLLLYSSDPSSTAGGEVTSPLLANPSSSEIPSSFTDESTPEVTSTQPFAEEHTTIISSTSTPSVMISSSMDHSHSSSTSSAPETSISPSSSNFRLSYRYAVSSSARLKIGNITDTTVLTSVQPMVVASFNLSGFNITVMRIEITSRTKATLFENDMLTDNLFQTHRQDCDESCIKANALSSVTPRQSFTLPDVNGSFANVTAKSGPQLHDDMSRTTPAPINHRKGERPPGVGARLGMGLGIPIISVLLFVEIVYFYRKYRNNPSLRESSYEIASYTNPPAI